MRITREQALNILKYLMANDSFYFPFRIICKDFDSDDECYDVDCADIKYEVFENDTSLVNFILEENLQELCQETVELIAKGFLDKIENTNNVNKISNLAIKYRKKWKKNLCESEDIEKFGLNEFLGGKADAYEECVYILDKYL